jgi:methylmalonyl-CoA epimerase
VGIAVDALPAALAFYRDALGLEVEPPEEVASQRVRAHFLETGEARLELLEATAPDSPIAKFTERRGPGLHHITLRVDDIDAALAQLKERGVRLIDNVPRQGAEGSRVAFIHPAAAHGVLVELKQVAAPTAALTVARHMLGDLELLSLYDGFFRLDGGAMFGVVPRPLWAGHAPPDDRNRIRLAMRPLVVRGARTMIIDAGMGDKADAAFTERFGVDRARHLDDALAEAGLSPDRIDIVLASHLHVDHAGGFTVRAGGRVRPRFPRARYVVRRGEWEDATRPHERNRASYRPDDFLPLAEAGVLELVDEDQTIMPGVRVRRTGGHTAHHQMVVIESGGQQAMYLADLVPTAAHVMSAWITAYDLYPVDTLTAKKAALAEAAARNSLLFFPHDPRTASGRLVERDGRAQLSEMVGERRAL